MIVRRAGKSPPGAASLRATSPGEQRSEEEHRPAKAAYERRVWFLFDDVGHRTVRVELPIPSTSAPRSRSRRAITSTSLMRGSYEITQHVSLRERRIVRTGKSERQTIERTANVHANLDVLPIGIVAYFPNEVCSAEKIQCRFEIGIAEEANHTAFHFERGPRQAKIQLVSAALHGE